MRILFVKDGRKRFVGREIREPFIKPRIQRFIVCEHSLIPAVCHLMRGYTHKAAEGSFTSDECAHRIFHSSIAALYDGIGFIGVLAEVSVHELKMPYRKIL